MTTVNYDQPTITYNIQPLTNMTIDSLYLNNNCIIFNYDLIYR